MRTITFIVLLCLCASFTFAQEKGELGVYTEGAWFTPKDSPGNSMKDGIATGVGLCYEVPIAKKLFGSIGVGYRYKQNQKYQVDYSEQTGGYAYGGYSPYAYYTYGRSGNWVTFPQHYVALPGKIKYKLKNNFFVQAGLEASWLLNYDGVYQKPEFNWSLGFGSKIGDLEWSVSYMRGTRLQGMSKIDRTIQIPTVDKHQDLRNRILMLNLSYPLMKF